jgi:hypothetical protein
MKKLIAIMLLIGSTSVFAQHYHHHGYWRHGGGSNWYWVAPTVLGGVIGYEIARNQPPVIVQQPPVVVQPPPESQQICSPWTEVRNPDGTVTATRTCTKY